MKKIYQYVKLLLVMVVVLLPIQQLLSEQVDDSAAIGGEQFDTLGHLSSYYRDLKGIAQEVEVTTNRDSLQYLDMQLKRIELKWGGYYQSNEQMIGTDDNLISIVVEWQVLLEQTKDGITYRKGLSEANEKLAEVRAELLAQDSLYDGLVKKAVSLSMVKKLAKQLEQLKADEQIAIGGVETDYGAVKALAEQYVELKPGVDSLDRLYVEIKQRSQTVQSQEFKPYVARVKDYLLSLAAVAMILMFFNMAHAKYKQLKAESKRLADLKKMMGGDQQYPTI